ncbi:MAG: hypothetical protein IPH49_05040 [Ignavibacteria bacterium]|nr:hypothetical protein [Ignavibacteria bacterium]
MQTQWFTASALMDLDITSPAEGLSATKASAMLVRKSDNQQLELPVLNVIGATTNGTTDSRAQKFSWKLLGDTTDLYRIVLSTRDDAALSVEDIEIGVVRRTNARSGHTANEVKNMGYIDGFAMRHSN